MIEETARLAALRGLDVLDTAPEQHFDHLADLAAEILDTPMALVSLVDEDRQWFKASHGLRATETPRAWSFCDHAVQMGPKGLLVVEDARLDPRFSDNPLVAGPHGFRFYAGAVLTTADGHNLGALCVIDTRPRHRPSDRKLNRLRILADMVVRAIEEKVLVQRLEARLALVDPAGQIDGRSATG